MRATSRRLLRAVLVLAGAGAGLLAAELALRAVQSGSPASSPSRLHLARPDRPWIYGLRPGASAWIPAMGEVIYRVNAEGFRDRVRSRARPAQAFRMLVLGDSIAFGYGVELRDAFPAQLQAHVQSLVPGRAVEALNFGVSGYNPYTEAALLEDVGADWQPNLVVAQFAINDLGDPTLGFDVQTRLAVGEIPEAAYPDPRVRGDRFALPRPLLRACDRLRLCRALDGLVGARALSRYRVPRPSPDDPAWHWLEAQYARMARFAAAQGAGFAIVVFPWLEQIGGADGPVPEGFRALGERLGVEVVDLLPAFRSASGLASPLFLDIWHPTPLGHRVAGRETAEALACAGLLPAPPPASCSRGPG